MRKILYDFLLAYTIFSLLLPATLWATDYYGCQAAQAVNGDSTWCTYANLESGSPAACTKAAAGSYTAAATAVQAGNNLYANGCTLSVTDSFTATLISTADAGAGTADFAGGGFTMDIGSVSGETLTTNITAGTTDCLTLTDAVDGADGNLAIIGVVTGGGSVNADGINDARLDAESTLTIGTAETINTNAINGGTSNTAKGFHKSAAAGIINIYNKCFGKTGDACYFSNSATTVNIYGDCEATGSSTSGNGSGYLNGHNASTSTITLYGSIIGSQYVVGASGRFIWSPSDNTKYMRFWNGSTNYRYLMAGLSSDVGGTAITAANTAANVKAGTYFVKPDDGVMTVGTAASGGGAGLWSF